jgi:hypothetical protein
VIFKEMVSRILKFFTVLLIRGSGAFLILGSGSGISFLRIPDPQPSFDSL